MGIKQKGEKEKCGYSVKYNCPQKLSPQNDGGINTSAHIHKWVIPFLGTSSFPSDFQILQQSAPDSRGTAITSVQPQFSNTETQNGAELTQTQVLYTVFI